MAKRRSANWTVGLGFSCNRQVFARKHREAMMIHKWKRALLVDSSGVFERGSRKAPEVDEKRVKDLHVEIGELAVRATMKCDPYSKPLGYLMRGACHFQYYQKVVNILVEIGYFSSPNQVLHCPSSDNYIKFTLRTQEIFGFIHIKTVARFRANFKPDWVNATEPLMAIPPPKGLEFPLPLLYQSTFVR